jgi:hypothetical protein
VATLEVPTPLSSTLSPSTSISKNDEEILETKAAISEALEQGDGGEGRPAEEVFAQLREARHFTLSSVREQNRT